MLDGRGICWVKKQNIFCAILYFLFSSMFLYISLGDYCELPAMSELSPPPKQPFSLSTLVFAFNFDRSGISRPYLPSRVTCSPMAMNKTLEPGSFRNIVSILLSTLCTYPTILLKTLFSLITATSLLLCKLSLSTPQTRPDLE